MGKISMLETEMRSTEKVREFYFRERESERNSSLEEITDMRALMYSQENKFRARERLREIRSKIGTRWE